MLMMSSTGLGELVFGKGQQFNCDTAKCWGAGQYDALFRELQNQANRAATKLKLSFTPLKIDGFIGAGTAALIGKIAGALPSVTTYVMLARLRSGAQMKSVAANADAIVPELTQLAIYGNVTSVTGGGITMPDLGPAQVAPPTTKPAVITTPPKLPTSWWDTVVNQPPVPAAGTQATITTPATMPPGWTPVQAMSTSSSVTRWVVAGAGLAAVGIAAIAITSASRRRKAKAAGPVAGWR